MSIATKKFVTLLKREIWEHRGGFIYTPIAIAGVLVLLLIMMAGSAFFWRFSMDGAEHMTKGALQLAAVNVPAEKLELAVLAFLWMTTLLWQSVLFIVLFFYCIGTLYDDRRDRSVLFWKSMPVSDLETVGSKAFTALIVAPLLMFVVMVVGQIVLLIAGGLVIALHGGSPWALVWSHMHPYVIWGQFLGVQAVQALYLLPLFAWLMLAGSFARGKPFLWAVLPPVVLAIVESYLRFTADFSLSRVIWEFIARRLASGVAPMSFSADFGDGHSMQSGFVGTQFAANFGDVMARLGTLDLWAGVAIGLAFLAGAVYLRRYRDESTS